MFAYLTTFFIARQDKAMPGCAIDLGNAFRHRIYLSDMPKSCK